jgi:hypothetical protein
MLPSLRQWVLEGGTETPLADRFTLRGVFRPENYQGGMLDGVGTLFALKNQEMHLMLTVTWQTVYSINGQLYFIVS